MQVNLILIFLLASVCRCTSKITLKNGVKEVVNFVESELKTTFENSIDGEESIICFGSKVGSVSAICPNGYAALFYSFSSSELDQAVRLNRQGKITCNFCSAMFNNVQFNDDGSLNIFVPETSKKFNVTVINGKRVVKSNEAAVSTVTIVFVILGVSFFIVSVAAIGFIVWFCFCRNPRTHQPVSTVAPEELPQVITQTTSRTPESQPRRRSSAVVKSHGMPSVIKRTSSSTTKPSNEKVNVPATMPLLTISAQVDHDVKKTVSVSKTTVTSLQEPKTTIVPTQVTAREKTSVTTSKTTIGEEKLPHVSPAPSQLPTTEATKGSPSMSVDLTQSASTVSTPEFGSDKTSVALAKNSEFKSRKYLRRSEAPTPGSSSRRRSAPIIDEVDNYRRISETYVCFGQRIKILGGHDHMRVTERINVELQHFTSNAERKLLKAAATDAPKFADIVVMEARERISKHAASHDYRRIDWEENSSFWNYINDPSTPASDGYVVLYTLVPEIFKLKEQSLADELVRKMPISGLYILLLDEKFPKNFRIDLAAELRRRASLIVPQVQMETLRESAFPVPYLAQACCKNGKSFVKGLEIHSKDPPKASKHK